MLLGRPVKLKGFQRKVLVCFMVPEIWYLHIQINVGLIGKKF